MYRDTPFKSYNQIQDGLRKKSILLRIARGRYAVLLQRFGPGHASVTLTFLLQHLCLLFAFVASSSWTLDHWDQKPG